MYIRRVKDEKREFLVRGKPVALNPGDGFTMVLDEFLYVLRSSRSGVTPQFESVKRSGGVETPVSLSSVPSTLSTQSKRGPDPFAYTSDLATTKSKSVSSAPLPVGDPIAIDDDDDELRQVMALSRATSGLDPKPDAAQTNSTEADEDYARQLQEQFDAEENAVAAAAKKAVVSAPTPRPVVSASSSNTTSSSFGLSLNRAPMVGTSKPGDLLGASSVNHLSTRKPVLAPATQALGRKQALVVDDSNLDEDAMNEMADAFSSAVTRDTSSARPPTTNTFSSKNRSNVSGLTAMGVKSGIQPSSATLHTRTPFQRPPGYNAPFQSKAKPLAPERPSDSNPVSANRLSMPVVKKSGALMGRLLEREKEDSSAPRKQSGKRSPPENISSEEESFENEDTILGDLQHISPKKRRFG